MIEPIIYFGIGFLVAALIGLVIVPLVHGRAVRLTMRRLEAATPLSLAEIQADKDQLRAEFAMSTRRLEMSVEQLKTKTTSQLAELGKKGDAINRLKAELGEKTATIFALEARDKALRDQVRASEEEFAVKTANVHDAERALADKQVELAKMMSELDERSVLADSQKIEIIALKTQVEAIKGRLSDAENEVKSTEDRVALERIELKETTHELSEERGRVENLGRRAQDMESRLTEQSRQLTQSEFELGQLREQIDTARKTESDLRAAIAEIDGRTSSATAGLKAEKAQLQAELDRTRDERDRLSRELANFKREAEQTWPSERLENALLRERINDVAAEVARLASALEGPNSPIDAILAAESARDKVVATKLSASGDVEITEVTPNNGNLADRIRALQSHASRAHGDDPMARN
jgi:chromosome segregation ATPase